MYEPVGLCQIAKVIAWNREMKNSKSLCHNHRSPVVVISGAVG